MRVSSELLEAGLSRDDVRRWLEVCWPAQIEAVLTDPRYKAASIQEKFRLGLRGVRGFKAGIKKERQRSAEELARTRVAERERALKARIAQANQDTQALMDEFL